MSTGYQASAAPTLSASTQAVLEPLINIAYNINLKEMIKKQITTQGHPDVKSVTFSFDFSTKSGVSYFTFEWLLPDEKAAQAVVERLKREAEITTAQIRQSGNKQYVVDIPLDELNSLSDNVQKAITAANQITPGVAWRLAPANLKLNHLALRSAQYSMQQENIVLQQLATAGVKYVFPIGIAGNPDDSYCAALFPYVPNKTQLLRSNPAPAAAAPAVASGAGSKTETTSNKNEKDSKAASASNSSSNSSAAAAAQPSKKKKRKEAKLAKLLAKSGGPATPSSSSSSGSSSSNSSAGAKATPNNSAASSAVAAAATPKLNGMG